MEYPLLHNDKLLLCSDGLTAHVTNEAINETINFYPDVQHAATKLIEKANQGGGSDNITVQIIHYTGKSSKKQKKKGLRKLFIAFLIITLLSAAGIYHYRNAILRKLKAQPEAIPSVQKTITPGSLRDSTLKPVNIPDKKTKELKPSSERKGNSGKMKPPASDTKK